MAKKQKATKLSVAGVPNANVLADVEPGTAANFSEVHVDAGTFDRDVRSADNWVRVGASLLRAARAILRQVNLDFIARTSPEFALTPGSRDSVVHQAIFLAALAVENGLKAVIAAGMPGALPNPPSGKLPADLSGHDLVDLASPGRAGIVPADDREAEALKRGQNYVEWLGRYPSSPAHDEHHTRAAVDAGAMFAAYERLFFRCVAESERRRYVSLGYPAERAAAEAASYLALFEWTADGVDPLPPGSVVPRIEVATYPGYVTWSSTG
jgi:hypothetical protein